MFLGSVAKLSVVSRTTSPLPISKDSNSVINSKGFESLSNFFKSSEVGFLWNSQSFISPFGNSSISSGNNDISTFCTEPLI